jgi:ATP-binding cassette, subfamily B, bacterial MsbA
MPPSSAPASSSPSASTEPTNEILNEVSIRNPDGVYPSFLRRFLPQDPGRRLLIRHLWINRRLFALTLFLTALSAVLEGLGVGALVPFLEGLLNTGDEPFRSGIAFVDTHLLAVDAEPVERLYRMAALLLCIVWTQAMVSFIAYRKSIVMRELVLDRIRREIIGQVQAVSLSFFSQKRSGDIINTLTSEVKRLSNLFDIGKELIIRSSMLLAYGAAIVWLSWELALLTVAFCVLLLLMLSRVLKKLRSSGKRIAETNANIVAAATELLNGIRTIMEFGTQKFEAQNFAEQSRVSRDIVTNTATKGALVHPITHCVSFTALLAIIIIAFQFFITPGYLNAAAFLAFMFVLMRIIPILKSINTNRAQWSVYRGALDDVASLIDPGDKPYLVDGTHTFEKFTDAIKIQNLSFGYEPGQEVIKDVNLTIQRGETVAIVGGSGAGKSTLVDLVARLYDPNEGRILFDGTDLRTFKQASLRSRMAIVNQTTFLFNTNVWENIAYGFNDHISRDAVLEAADEANALEFIENLPDGFDTVLGERGARLSGGQRQRIAIARALLRDPDILILDEATSALDSASEKLVQDSLDRLMENRTVIVIAHRLSTVESANRVVVLEEGRIVEAGSYDDLLEKKGQLWKYHNLQFQMA